MNAPALSPASASHPVLENVPIQEFARGPDWALIQGNCLEVLPQFPEGYFHTVFADPPYFLSNNGITCHAGQRVSVNKGKWDESHD